MKYTAIYTILTTVLMACATPYQTVGLRGGYKVVQVDENVFQIGFSGNSYTSLEVQYDYALLAAAETSLKLSCEYFVAVDNTQQSFSVNQSDVSVGLIKGNDSSYAYRTNSGQVYKIVKPGRKNTFVCFNNKPTAPLPGLLFNAKTVSRSIKEQYGISN